MMDEGRKSWMRTAILVGVLYLVVGIASSTLAGPAVSNQMRSFWRMFAFVISGVVFVAHIGL